MKESYKNIKISLEYSVAFLVIFWIIQIVVYVTGINLSNFGIYPRSTDGLLGILTSPFIHGNPQHLIANSIPFGILSTLLFFFYRKKSILIFILIWITAGIFTWVIGRVAWHIGASSIIYGMASFLFFGGIMSKKIKLIIVSVIVMLAYSGLVWGIFPSDGQISWEGHLSGAIGGFIWAYLFRKSLV